MEEDKSRRRTPPNDRRRDLVLRDIDINGNGLEIGPSYSPLLPKAFFPGVKVLDHADADSLREKYRGMGLDDELIARIEEVEYRWEGGPFLEAIPEGEAFSFIVGSHILEHTVDLVGFLQDAQVLLKPGGRMVLFIPDMRFCFDCLQSLSSIGPVLDAHDRPTVFHPPGALLDHLFYATKRGDSLVWVMGRKGPLRLQFREISSASTWRALANEQAEYFDIHRWRFTPSSLQLLLRDLASMDLHRLRPVREPLALGYEFMIVLERDDTYRPPFDPELRLALLKKIDRERRRAFSINPLAGFSARLKRSWYLRPRIRRWS